MAQFSCPLCLESTSLNVTSSWFSRAFRSQQGIHNFKRASKTRSIGKYKLCWKNKSCSDGTLLFPIKWTSLVKPDIKKYFTTKHTYFTVGTYTIVWYGMVFRGGFPHAPRPLYGLLYVPFEFHISRHTLAARRCRSPHVPENGGTICRRNWKLCMYLNGKWPVILLRGPLGAWGSFTCSKYTTRIKRLNVPPGGPPPGSNPRHSGHEVGTLPLDHGSRLNV
jgi:hypothetical protein